MRGLLRHRKQRFHESVAGAVRGITVAVLMTTLPRLQLGEPWYATERIQGPDAGCVRCSEWPGGLLIWMAGFTPREGSTAVSEKQQRNVAWGGRRSPDASW